LLSAVRRPQPVGITIVLGVVLAAVLGLTALVWSDPSTALGATSVKIASCWTSLRIGASTSSHIQTNVHSGTHVTVVGTVAGGSWRASCDGRTVSSTSWYRISAINGKSVMSLYGRSYLYAVTVRFRAATSSGPSPTPPPPSSASRYGPGIGADSLANTQVGGPDCGCSNIVTSYRFRATTTSSLTSIRVYLQGGSGYSGGTGGRIRVSVQPDNGASSHAPASTILASTTVTPGNPIRIGNLPLITFASPARLTAGRLYHLVFRNIDSNPRANFVSVNALWTRAATSPRQPGMSDVDWGQLMNTGSGWKSRPNYTPILDLGYSNGVHAGMGYMEVWVGKSRSISGGSAVREVFTPRASRTVGAVSVRVARPGGSGALTVRLLTSGGTVLATGHVSAGAVGSSIKWVGATLSAKVSLRAATTYQLVLTSPNGTTWSTWALERGNHYHFASTTYFSDGHGEYTTGSGWSGFDQPGGTSDAVNADLQFLLK
jgi:hypothetical protein